MAIKVLRAAFPGDAAAELHSFRREVRVLSTLQHDRIVGLLGVLLPDCTQVLMLLLQTQMHLGGMRISWHVAAESGVLQHAINTADFARVL